jgi:RNA polymerase sigma-70 factor (ECF subfamily)
MDPSELRDELARHHAAAFGWAMACCGRDASVAEAALQSAYLKVLDGRARFDGRALFRTWLFGVIRRTAAEERRRARLHQILLFRLWSPPHADSPEETSYQGQLRARLVAALRRLSRRQREVVELVAYHDMTLDEAAAVMEISPGSARQHYARAKERLRELLSDLGVMDERRSRPANVV